MVNSNAEAKELLKGIPDTVLDNIARDLPKAFEREGKGAIDKLLQAAAKELSPDGTKLPGGVKEALIKAI